jgi:periplasmic protein TonB
METKKTPSKDVHRMSGLFFQIGLITSLTILITAFEWSTEENKVALRFHDEPVNEPILSIPQSNHKEPAPPSPIKKDLPIVKSTSPDKLTVISDSDPEPDADEIPDIETPLGVPQVSTIPEDAPEDCLDCFFIVVEKNAEPIGGYESFYKFLSNNLKYPLAAQRNEIEGKVFVEFIVNRDGIPSDMKVLKGIGFGLDEEAKRVIGLSKWNPGKQRGKPVRVKMVMTIVFKLK